MLLRKHSKARCPNCDSPLWYGCKTEPTGWKVQYTCPGPDGCGRTFSVGRVPLSAVESEDEAYERAAALGSAYKRG